MWENRLATLLTFVVLVALVAAATVIVVETNTLHPSRVGAAYSCPSLPGGTGPIYCENLTLPLGSGDGCSVGPNDTGVFHGVSYSFHTFVTCPALGEGINGTIQEPGGDAQHLEFLNGAPPLIGWFNWTSPDGKVGVDSFTGAQDLTLVVRE